MLRARTDQTKLRFSWNFPRLRFVLWDHTLWMGRREGVSVRRRTCGALMRRPAARAEQGAAGLFDRSPNRQSGHSGAWPQAESPESITRGQEYGFRARLRFAQAPRNDALDQSRHISTKRPDSSRLKGTRVAFDRAAQRRSPRKTCPPCLRIRAITLPLASRSKSISAPTRSATKISLSTDATSSGPWLEPCT